MMNEKRFELVSVCGDFGIIDTITDEVWFFETYESVVKVVDLLNEQQSMIDQLEKENKQLRKTIALFEVEEDEINFLKEVVVVDDE